MKTYSRLLLLLALLVPSAANAQKKPGNNKDTRSAEVYLTNARNEGVIADKQKFYQQALAATQSGARSAPDNARVWLLMGEAQVGLQNLAAADSAFDKAEQLYPPYAEETEPHRLNAWIGLYNQGITQLQGGDNAAAIESLEKATAIYQGRPEALTTLGQLYQQQQDLAKAEQAFRGALEILGGPNRQGLSPEDEAKWAANEEQSLLRLAGLLAQSDRPSEAVTLYQDFVKKNPTNAAAKANLGVALMQTGREAEAAPIFNELLDSPELDGGTLFNVGVGLFRANQYEQAARAFERTLAEAPYSHDAVYNLSQAIYAQAAEVEKARAGKTGAELAAANEKLVALYTRMGEVAERLMQLDPANNQAIMMLAHSQRARGELTTDAARAEEWKRAVLATLELHDAMTFEVEGLQVVPANDKVMVMGKVKNLKAAAGTPLKINFILLNDAGAGVAEQEVSVNAPAVGETDGFSAEITAPESASAWKYVVVK